MNYLYVHVGHFLCVHEFYADDLFLRILKLFCLKRGERGLYIETIIMVNVIFWLKEVIYEYNLGFFS